MVGFIGSALVLALVVIGLIVVGTLVIRGIGAILFNR